MNGAWCAAYLIAILVCCDKITLNAHEFYAILLKIMQLAPNLLHMFWEGDELVILLQDQNLARLPENVNRLLALCDSPLVDVNRTMYPIFDVQHEGFSIPLRDLFLFLQAHVAFLTKIKMLMLNFSENPETGHDMVRWCRNNQWFKRILQKTDDFVKSHPLPQPLFGCMSGMWSYYVDNDAHIFHVIYYPNINKWTMVDQLLFLWTMDNGRPTFIGQW